MLPSSLLQTAENHPMLVELRNGDTYNGRLVKSNMYMNICLQDVICTSRDGTRFWKMNECYIHGNSIKYLRVPNEILEMVPAEEERERKQFRNEGGRGHGRGRGRGEGRGEGRGGRGDGRGGRGRDGGRGREGRGSGRGGGRN